MLGTPIVAIPMAPHGVPEEPLVLTGFPAEPPARRRYRRAAIDRLGSGFRLRLEVLAEYVQLHEAVAARRLAFAVRLHYSRLGAFRMSG